MPTLIPVTIYFAMCNHVVDLVEDVWFANQLRAGAVDERRIHQKLDAWRAGLTTLNIPENLLTVQSEDAIL